VSKKQILIVAGILITPLLLWFLESIWMTSYVTVPTTLLFPDASLEMFVEKKLGPPDILGAPTILGILLACIRFPIYGWLIGKASIVSKSKMQISRITACHFGISVVILFIHFAEIK
jgi:hypothetical protein